MTDRILDIHPGVTVGLNNLTVKDGEAATFTPPGNQGGNILFRGGNSDILQLVNVDVLNGLASNLGGQGGGIATLNGAQVLIQGGSLIQDNVAGGTGAAGQGGGIYMTGTGGSLTVEDSEILSNDAGFNGGAGASGRGGGIQFDAAGPATVSLDNATVDGNRAAGGNSDGDGRGGGLDVSSSGSVNLMVTGGSISTNEAGGGSASDGFGGGLNFGADSGSVTLDGATVNDNHAGFNPAAGNNLTGTGGGVGFESLAADLEVIDTTIDGNTAGEGFQSTGGGVSMVTDGDMTITDSVISANTSGASDNAGTGQGGGVYRNNPSALGAVDLISESTISGNSAAGGLFSRGGGVSVNTAGSFTLDSSTVTGNTITAFNTAGLGGGVSLDGSLTAGPGVATVINSTVSGNTATSGEDPMTASGEGGGVSLNRANQSLGDIDLVNSTIAGNTAVNADGNGFGGNLSAAGPANRVDLRATIISGGSASPFARNCDTVGTPGVYESIGGNVEGPGSSGGAATNNCELTQASDRRADPLLGPLAANGGTTMTRALLAGSPAIDLVPAALCPPPATDQRGVARPLGPACDAGAFEAPFTAPPVTRPPAKKQKCKKKKKRSAAVAKKCKKKKKRK